MNLKALIFAAATLGIHAKSNNISNPKTPVVNSLEDLQLAINNANEEVETTITVGSFSLTNASVKDAMRNLNINGKKIIIKGENKDTTIKSLDQGSFYIIGQGEKTNSVTFEDITFEQAIDESKNIMTPNNAISVSKNSCSTDLTIKNCKFKNYVGERSSGGAIQIAFSNADDYKLNLRIEDCSFVNCSSKIGGGALSIDGVDNTSIDIKNSTFEGCHSPLGGAISLRNVKASLSQCVFKENGETKGGAIFMAGCDSFVDNNAFIDNISSSNGSSVYVENSKFHNNLFINNSFINKESDYKEFLFSEGEGSLSDVKAKLYLNTFVSEKDMEISYEEYLSHYEEYGNLYISKKYSKEITRNGDSAYTSNKEVIKQINEKHCLANDASLKLDYDVLSSKLGTFYKNIYGDFFVGDNLSDSFEIVYGGKKHTYKTGETPELNDLRFGFDLVNNKIGDKTFTFENALLSSNSPVYVEPIYELNLVGGLTFIGSPMVIVLLVAMIALIIILRKKHQNKTNEEEPASFDINKWANQFANDEVFSSLTSKEKEVLVLVLKDTPRKEIAAKLFISESTVKNHITKIFSKLNIKNRSELLKMLDKK